MRITQIILILTLLSISCSERTVPDESQRKADSKRIIEELDLPDGYVKTPAEVAEALHVSPTDVILCGMDFTLDMKSHTWIYRFDDPNRFSHSILFRWSDHDQNPHDPSPRHRVEGEERTMEVFRETISNDKLLRTLLTREEALGELAKIEDYLVGYLGEKTYLFYYQGGEPEEPEYRKNANELPSNDLGALAEPKSAQEFRDLVNYLNHGTARSIATLIQDYRRTQEVEQAVRGNAEPATR